jgi:hypothetical protein
MLTQTPADERPSMTIQEAATYIGCAASSLKTARCRGGGPPFYRGLSRMILYRRSDLDRFIASRRIEEVRHIPEASQGVGGLSKC